ncbi:MAG TPA: hypothetical protein VKC66_23470 [Xanthobacteraceae bacterium]|nr:hypothetical protein [Xanthobacteraceae bacterium]
MNDGLTTFAEVATGFSRSPLGILALFIVLVYGFASLVTGLAKKLTSAEKMPLIYFLVGFPILVLGVFTWLVSEYPANLFGPGDFKSDDNFLEMRKNAAATRFQTETNLQDFPNAVLGDETISVGSNGSLKGWTKSGDTPSEYEVGTAVKDDGTTSAYIKLRGLPQGFGTLMQIFKADAYRGKRLRMSASAKSDGVRNWAGFWMRVDEPKNNAVSFDNMQDRPIKGTTGWTTYKIVLDVPENSSDIAFGLLLDGPGQVWFSNFDFEIVSNNVTITGRIEIPDRPLNLNFKE